MNRTTALRLFGHYCRLTGVLGVDRPGETALKAFAKAPQPNVTPKQAAFLSTARRSDVDFEGERVAAYEWGEPSAPYVFTAYGWGYNAGRWRHFAPQLVAAGYRVCAYDYLGHGRSTGRGLVYTAMLRLHVRMLEYWGRPALALAHSFGAGTLADLFAGLPAGELPERMALLAPFSDLDYIFRQYAGALGFGKGHYASLDRAVVRRTGKRIGDFDVAASVRRLGGLPALIAHDPEDAVTAFTNAERLHAHWPGSLLYAAAGAGHGLADAAATEAVLSWLVTGQRPRGAVGDGGRGAPKSPSETHSAERSAYFTAAAATLR